MLFCASSEGSGESAHLHRLTLAVVTVPKFYVLPQKAICVLFTPAAKTLLSLHNCAGIVTRQCDRYQDRSHVLTAKALASLHICSHSNEISCAG